MKKFAILIWLLLPLLVGAYHLGPGQQRMTVDDAGQAARLGDDLAKQKQWEQAVTQYDVALQLLPEDRHEDGQRIRLAKAKAHT